MSALGLVTALAANFLSPRGLSLARNYFPEKEMTTAPPAAIKGEPTKEKNWAMITTGEAQALFHDPQYEQESIVFVDAGTIIIFRKATCRALINWIAIIRKTICPPFCRPA